MSALLLMNVYKLLEPHSIYLPRALYSSLSLSLSPSLLSHSFRSNSLQPKFRNSLESDPPFPPIILSPLLLSLLPPHKPSWHRVPYLLPTYHTTILQFHTSMKRNKYPALRDFPCKHIAKMLLQGTTRTLPLVCNGSYRRAV